MNSQLNTVCFRQFAVLLVLVSQFQTISSDWFANINADFILPSLHYPSASTEFVSNPLIVKPLQHAIQAIETNKGTESHIAGLYTQGPRMMFLIVFIIWCFFQLVFFSFSLNRKSHSSWNYRQCRSPKKWGEGGGGGGGGTPGTLCSW